MSNKEIFLKSFTNLLYLCDKFIKYAAYDCSYLEKKKRDEYNDNYYKYLNYYKKAYEEIEKDSLEKYNIQINDIKKVLYNLRLEKDLYIVKNKQNKPIAISFIRKSGFYSFYDIKNSLPYISYKNHTIVSLNFSKKKMKSFKMNYSIINLKKKIDQKRNLKKLYKFIDLILDMYNHKTFDSTSKDYDSLETRTKKFKKFLVFYDDYLYNRMFGIKKDIIFKLFNNNKLFKIEKEDLICDQQEYVIVYNNSLKLIYFSLYKEQVYCNDFSLYGEKKDKDYRLCAIEFLRDYMTMSLV